MRIKVKNMKLQGKSFIIILGALLLVNACSCKQDNVGDKELTEKVKTLEAKEKDLLKELEPLHESFIKFMCSLDSNFGGSLSAEEKKTITDTAYKFEYTGSETASFVSEWETIKNLKNKDNPIITAISSATCTIMAATKKPITVIQGIRDKKINLEKIHLSKILHYLILKRR